MDLLRGEERREYQYDTKLMDTEVMLTGELWLNLLGVEGAGVVF